LGIGGLGIGDWGLGIGDWAQSPIPNPQSPIPNPQSPYQYYYLTSTNKKNKFIIYQLNNVKLNKIKLTQILFILFYLPLLNFS